MTCECQADVDGLTGVNAQEAEMASKRALTKTTRRDLLRMGAAGTVAAGIGLAAKTEVAQAAVGSGLAYHVHGILPLWAAQTDNASASSSAGRLGT
jgi:hypothetical protein